jgi:hypothetical protein
LEQVPLELRPLLPERFDAEAFRAFDLPIATCGKFWRDQVAAGLPTLQSLPPQRLLTLRYEDFFVEAKAQLDTIAAFLGEDFVDECWSTRCAATVRTPRSTWRDLPADDARALTEACREGFEMLQAVGVEYEF